MKNAMIVMSFITLVFAILLIYFAFKESYLLYSFIFLFLGILAIASAIRYTVGNSAYGYRGYGDVFVFIFFGLVSVIGVFQLYGLDFEWLALFPAITIGLWSTAVLNLNNFQVNLRF